MNKNPHDKIKSQIKLSLLKNKLSFKGVKKLGSSYFDILKSKNGTVIFHSQPETIITTTELMRRAK